MTSKVHLHHALREHHATRFFCSFQGVPADISGAVVANTAGVLRGDTYGSRSGDILEAGMLPRTSRGHGLGIGHCPYLVTEPRSAVRILCDIPCLTLYPSCQRRANHLPVMRHYPCTASILPQGSYKTPCLERRSRRLERRYSVT